MITLAQKVKETYTYLHNIPELGFQERQTSAYLADKLERSGYVVQKNVGITGIIAILDSGFPGPTVGFRADMDALGHEQDGQVVPIHSCGHDAHSAIVLTMAQEIARRGIVKGKVKIIFQPAEELMIGAKKMIATGLLNDLDILFGIHLRPIHDAVAGQAVPALYTGASTKIEVDIQGLTAHAARPHLGINAADAVAAIINGVHGIVMDTTVSSSIKVTKIRAGGAALNAIPDHAELVFDVRAQQNDVMKTLLNKAEKTIEFGALTVGATVKIRIQSGVPAAELDEKWINLAQKAILATVGAKGLLPPQYTPGGEDFHFFKQEIPGLEVGFIGLGADVTPGLHHPGMTINQDSLADGVQILLFIVDQIIELKG